MCKITREHVTQIVVFPDGERIALAMPDGVFVLSESGATRLLPDAEACQDHFEEQEDEDPEDILPLSVDMEHIAVSQRGDLILMGHQCSAHLVFDAELNQIASIGHKSEYPHYAWFSADGSMAAFNSCHFYHGATIGAPVDALKGLETSSYEKPEPPLRMLEEGARVYAAVARNDEFIIGDANGYLRAFDLEGNHRWQHFIGSTITGLDLSPDGKMLAVSSCAGFLCVLRLDADEPDPFAIGGSGHREIRRWLFWKGEEPLKW